MYKTALTVCAALLLGACSGNSPGKSTFEKAINQHISQQGVCVPLTVKIETNGMAVQTLLGLNQIKIPDRNANGDKINQSAIAQMKILDSEGFYKKQSSETFEFPGTKNKTSVYVYELTEKGKGKIREEGLEPRFCIGTQKVEKINWFTEPTPSDGMTVSKVSYEARFETEKWAEKFLKEAGNGWKHPEATRTKTATLVKTNDGWRDIRELQ
ncbi:hypothetical protein [Neisseria zoodegmatis]|uniref:Lipoprotein n=1 Tax=Neisseria zoodegmatis TaxID=326523 RepID=A0AB38DS75_9NEIS|nr:hypothetical protein [Neisseria zoodegmatis]OSI11590.1 hypothetical protein BWD10_01070 [Neisseria zoodegmatis]SNU79857.1 Uncharacterised protein [Neisseria zoodegmatis]